MITSSPLCASERAHAYDRLHPEIRRWIREQGWDDLRDLQSRAIDGILGSANDVLLAAATASGKTEAAFLPALTAIADGAQDGLAILYVSPLKALINDQFRRLDLLCERLGVPVVRWHGDAPRSAKAKTVRNPSGVALITPESIEALLLRRPADARRLLGSLAFVIVDELHAFMSGPRGLHLASLLKRVEAFARGPARRIGLSATIGDLNAAAAWLRPEQPSRVTIIESSADAPELRLQIRGYLDPETAEDIDEAENEQGATRQALDAISDHLFATLRGSNNLVFGGSRRTVEAIADRLRRRSEMSDVPNEFFPHHGSLSKELREELETRLKADELPTTAVCTSTLELGIDIGSVSSVAQVGAPRSLASLRQRLGRSGRRPGLPAILRVYVREPELGKAPRVMDELRPNVVRAVAAIRLLLARFVEPATENAALATALLHQTLSVIAERGGERADVIFRLLSGPGPFASIAAPDYVELLRGAAGSGLIEQAPDGTLMLGAAGERLVDSREMYALFESDAEWRLVVGTKTLGTIPLTNVVSSGNLVVFAGRRWLVESVDERTRVLQVAPHQGGKIPKFERLYAEDAHDRLVAEMRAVYEDDDSPAYLDERARGFLQEARDTYRRFELDRKRVIEHSGDLELFLWEGTWTCSVFAAAFAMAGIEAEVHDLGVTIPKMTEHEGKAVVDVISRLTEAQLASIGHFVCGIRTAKLDEFVPEPLLRRLWMRRSEAAIARVPSLAADLLSSAAQ